MIRRGDNSLKRITSHKHLAVRSASPSQQTTQIIIGQQSRCGRSIKRFGDAIFSLGMLSIGAPLFICIALLVKASSPGPIFYIQRRVGRNYKHFGCIKFRTMKVDAEAILSTVLSDSPSMKKEFERDFKLRKDPRITHIGNFLRRSSLDELPQFFNILKGEMSLVGPRPIVDEELERYGEYMEEVASVRPGLTGLWQVSGRNNLSYERRVRLDLAYARERSFLLDLAILRYFLFPII